QSRMRTKLSSRCVDTELVEACIGHLVESNYICDQRLTESYIRMATEKGSDGPLKIALKLTEKGISRELIDEHLVVDNEVWLQNAASTLAKKFRLPPTDRKEWQKQAGFLYNRGFTMDQIRYAVGAASRDDC